MINHALQYLSKSKSVIPVGKDKTPLVEWKQFTQRLATEDEVRGWWTKYPEANIGIITGKISNITVVDIDKKSGGLETLKTLDLPDTLISQTGGGGMHYFYQYQEGMNNRAGVYQGVDIRGEGGYVVVAPSLHVSGERYKWISTTMIAPFPKDKFELRAKNDWSSLVQGVGPGNRNDSAAKIIGKLMSTFGQKDWESVVWEMAKDWNSKNTPPMGERELRTVFESIARRSATNMAPEVEVEIKNDYKLRYTWGTRCVDTKFAIIKRTDFIIIGAKRSSGKTTYTFDMACKNALLGHKVLYISLEMEEMDIKEDFARKRAGITVEEELDYKIPEDKKVRFQEKLDEFNRIENLYFAGIRRGGNADWNGLMAVVAQYKELDLIFIDNLDLIEGFTGENDNDRQKRIVKNILNFTSEKKVPIVLLHHYRKSGSSNNDKGMDELSGSGKISDGADRVVKIERNQDVNAEYPLKYESRLTLQKARGYSEAFAKIHFLDGTFIDLDEGIINKDKIIKLEDYAKSNGTSPRQVFGYDN